ncbi:hypothetical protein [Longimicrobium sp.]|uniref:hypothetical protein n=1 Tax=Longimicrobium sp. TaxID=2029185 RepID=UPI002C0B37FE|nr:hypothetical protein [Longimicrobium sp.]HSU15096.1 hypothetical protein [Longimicrobium sp.]
MKKLELSIDRLEVDSFPTAAAAPPEPGTVQGQAADCTSPATCKCPTSLWACGTVAFTAYSCPASWNCV